MDTLTTYLFARPTFLGGMASTLDIGGTLVGYNAALTPEQADSLALASDWAAVGGDLWAAVDEYDLEHTDEVEA